MGSSIESDENNKADECKMYQAVKEELEKNVAGQAQGCSEGDRCSQGYDTPAKRLRLLS